MMTQFTDKRNRFFDLVFSSRFLAVMYYVIVFNPLIFAYSLIFGTDDYTGLNPLKWFAVSIVCGLFAFEVVKARKTRKDRQELKK